MVKRYFLFFAVFLSLFQNILSNPFDSYIGKWILIKEKSTPIELYESLTLEFQRADNYNNKIIFIWGSGDKTHKDTLNISPDSGQYFWHIHDRVFPVNVFLGIRMPVNSNVTGQIRTDTIQKELKLTKTYPLLTSQGTYLMQENDLFKLTARDSILQLIITFSSRDLQNKYHYTFKRKGYREAWITRLTDNWEVQGDLDVQAFLLSIQGLVNRKGPELYFIYPKWWDYHFTEDFYHYLEEKKNFTFQRIQTLSETIKIFKNKFKGYIVWDKNKPATLDLAFTLAGLKDGVVVSEDLIPLVENAGLPLLEDLRGSINQKSNHELYRRSFEQYGKQCNQNMLVWLGGESGKIRKSGIADWGIMNKAFFTDLSTKSSDTAEYNVAKEIISSYKPLSVVYGWHVYTKDKERDYVKLASRYGLRVEGLHTLPNISFMHHIPLERGFSFHNNHHLQKRKKYKPRKRIYISCVQTDCLGLGAWNQPGRGKIPYAWEVTMNWSWIAPVMLEYFYAQATPQDFFIGSLSGPGYIYPKAVPEPILPVLLDSAYSMMKSLDLNVFEIMDYSEGSTIKGNTELPEKIVDEYYRHMPEAIGFINGYAPSYTYAVRNKIPFISFDYYLSPDRSVKDAISDLKELARMNIKRPYFLLLHVRQWNDINKVINILKNLGKDYKIVPLDIFLKMAGEYPTFQSRFLEKQTIGREK